MASKNCMDCGLSMVCHFNRKRCVGCAAIAKSAQVKEAGRRWDQNNKELRSRRNSERHRANRPKYTAKHRAWVEKNRGKVHDYTAAYWKKNKDRMSEQYQRWIAENRGSRFGLIPGEYQKMLAAQGGLCAICHQPQESKRSQFLSIDHDHSTDRVRELLCLKCNTALGMVNDSPEILRSMIRYLEKHRVAEDTG